MEWIINVPNKTIEQIEAFIKALETAHGIKLMTKGNEDTVDGYVTYYHDSGDLKIHLYDKDESPNEKHRTVWRKTIVADAKNKINAVLDLHK